MWLIMASGLWVEMTCVTSDMKLRKGHMKNLQLSFLFSVDQEGHIKEFPIYDGLLEQRRKGPIDPSDGSSLSNIELQ